LSKGTKLSIYETDELADGEGVELGLWQKVEGNGWDDKCAYWVGVFLIYKDLFSGKWNIKYFLAFFRYIVFIWIEDKI